MNFKKVWMVPTFATLAVFASACGGGGEESSGNGSGENSGNGSEENSGSGSGENSGNEGGGEGSGGSGDIAIDGSSTVFPIMEAVSEEFQQEHGDIEAPVGVSGSGGGFERFIAGETDLSNASRPIEQEEEEALEEAGIEYTELELAYDGLTVAVNPENDFVDSMTFEELSQVFADGSDAQNWSDIRDSWPDEQIDIYAPGTDSGTYDFFAEEVLDEGDVTREAQLSEDDNVLVNGIAGSQNAIGFFGYAYYAENQDSLKAVPIVPEEDGDEGIEPNEETVNDQSYPLSRPLFTYVKNESLQQDEDVEEYVRFLNENAGTLAEEVGYVAAPDEVYEENTQKIDEVVNQ